MALRIGSHLGGYEILSLLGAGGMGEVYRARDHRLARDVALKVLPAAVVGNADRVARFEREARALAAINHPSIATIHGVEDADGVRAIVMELVPGETLTERMLRSGSGANRALPMQEALDIARQIADALDAAHAHGVVHRDLKPDNIKITPTGVVKVLDFGLARMLGPEEGGWSASQAETVADAATCAGVVLGTAAYMSPEHARGLPVDKRSDVWAFGCVLYELLSGQPAFGRATLVDTFAAVLDSEPDWECLPETMPTDLRRLLRRCLHKDPHQRLRDIGDVRILLDEALGTADPAATAHGPSAPRARRGAVWLAVSAAPALLAAGFGAALYLRSAPPLVDIQTPMRLSIAIPSAVAVPQLGATISPDGREVAFVATDAPGKSMLWVRALDTLEGRVLPGTENAIHPFWSADGTQLGFVADGSLKITDAAGGAVTALATTDRGGGTWSGDGVILFTRGYSSGLWRIPAAGGTPAEVTHLDAEHGEVTHGWPQFLPDGRRFLYFVQSIEAERRGVYVGSLDSPESKQVLASDFQAIYAPPGYLLFVRDEQLFAQRFDLERLQPVGDATIVAEGIWVAQGAGRAAFSTSSNGTLVHMNASLWSNQLTWFDRQGRPLGALGAPDRYVAQIPQLSPDGSRVAIARGIYGREQVWILDAQDGTSRRLTFDGPRALHPVWSANGRRVMFMAFDSQALPRLAIKNADGTGDEERLFDMPLPGLVDWAAGERFVVYSDRADLGLPDLWTRSRAADGDAVRLTTTDAAEYQVQISPDERWLAYTSNESGRDEVYVQRLPAGGSKRQVSVGGGIEPRWRADGMELYYLAADGRLMAVPVLDPAELALGAPAPLFQTALDFAGFAAASVPARYAVTADGQRFLLNVRPADRGAPITVVTHWQAALPP